MNVANGKSNNTEFWNEQGGQAWVANIETTEKLLGPLNRLLMARAGASPGETVLDIGCGGGRTTLELATGVGDAGRVMGVDVSAPILGVARDRAHSARNVGFELADAAIAELGSNRFDLLFSRFGVMFFDAPEAAIGRGLEPVEEVELGEHHRQIGGKTRHGDSLAGGDYGCMFTGVTRRPTLDAAARSRPGERKSLPQQARFGR